MKPIYTSTLLLAIVACLPACRKLIYCIHCEPVETDSVTVYAAGYVYDGTGNTATYWKNGQAVLLPPAINSNSNSFAYGMALSGKDIYIVGASPTGAVYWKNGLSQAIGQNSPQAAANAITVSGTDVYVAGTILNTSNGPNNLAVYWKNGTQVTLGQQGFANANANGIVVSGNDVYVSGWSINGGPFYRAMYWKNGNPVFLTGAKVASQGFGITVHGNDIYVAGVADDAAAYWKNGQLVTLPGPGPSGAGAVAVIGNDVYVTGGIYNRAKSIFNAVYWKNGQMIPLGDTAAQSHATCIAVRGNDVYIGGMVAATDGARYHQFEATYWKNGVATTLTYNGNPGYRYVNAIAVY